MNLASCDCYQYLQSTRVACDVLRKLSQRKSEELMQNLSAHGFDELKDKFYELIGRKGLDSYINKALIDFRNSYA